jgi:outer membrane protein assembly factor BamB
MPLRLAALVPAVAFAAPLLAADWPRFRGPNGTGVVEGAAPVQFDLKKDAAWVAKLPGVGHGSPIVVGDKVLLQTAAADGSTRTVLCLSAKDGRQVWAHTTAGRAAAMHKKNNFGSPTPCADGERVYAASWDGRVVTLTALALADGKEVWKRTLGEFANEHGFGHSPMAHDGAVYFNFDHQDSAELLAFDAKTGEPRWAAKRKGHRACYTVPLVLDRGGKPEVVVGSTTSVDGYDPDTGKPNWSYTVPWAKGDKMLRAIGQPVVAAGRVVTYFGEGGSGRYMVAVKAGGSGDVTRTGKAWELTKGTPYVPGLLTHRDHLYWVGDDGMGACADAKTGEVKWSERVLQKGVSASPILVGDTVLAVAEDGKAVAFRADPNGPGELKKSDVGEAVFASPAAANGRLYLRGSAHLFCIPAKGL